MAALKSLDDAVKPLAMRNYSMACKALIAVTQKRMAELHGISESTLSDWKEDHLERAMQVIAAAGMKVVPKDEQTYSAAKIAALKLFAREGMDREEANSDWGSL